MRFIIENTVEERILRLQQKKELVFEGQVKDSLLCVFYVIFPNINYIIIEHILVHYRTVGGSQEAIGKLTVEDMRFLFTT